MIVALINFSGNVGKSTLAKHLFAPRLNAEVFSLESQNSDEGGTRMSGKDWKKLQQIILDAQDHPVEKNVVLDIGSSNINELVTQMTEFRGSHQDIDMYIVPTVRLPKQQIDSISTIDALHQLGVPAKKIKVLFNQLPPDEKAAEIFKPILAYTEAEKKCIAKESFTVFESSLFQSVRKLGMTIPEFAADTTDYRELRKTATTPEEKEKFGNMMIEHRRALGVNENLDIVFKAIMK